MTIDHKKINKLKPHSVLEGLPQKLKDPKCFKKIEDALRKVMFSDHSHKTIKAFMGCKRCQTKHHKRREMIKEFGFKSLEQYMEWKKIMDVIVNERSITVSNRFVK